jgi:hypothetical protein
MQTLTLPAGRKDSSRAAAQIASLPCDRAWKVVVEQYKPRRSDQQNRYLWGCVYATILKEGGEALAGWHAEDLHEYFLGEWGGWETLEGFGRKRMRAIKRSSRLNKTDFADYVAFIQLKAAGLGIIVPDPEGNV